jgi:invasion protein IalB
MHGSVKPAIIAADRCPVKPIRLTADLFQRLPPPAVKVLPAMAAPERQAQPATATAVPERTTSVFGDWTMSCTQRTGGIKQCETSLTIQDQQRQIGLVLAIGRAAKGQPLVAVLQVPANIRTADPVRPLDGDPVTMAFNQCNRPGCFAQLELKDDSLLRRLRAHDAETPGHIKWHDSGNTEIVAPLSTRGFGAAMDALTAADNGKS